MNEKAINRSIFFDKYGYNLFCERNKYYCPFANDSINDKDNIFGVTLHSHIDDCSGTISLSFYTNYGDTCEHFPFKEESTSYYVTSLMVDYFTEYIEKEGEDQGITMEFFNDFKPYIEAFFTNAIKIEFMLAQNVLREMKKSDLFTVK